MGAVTGFQFAIGDGVDTTFDILDPSGDVAINPVVSALYRTDWQGKQTLATTSRTNIAPFSQDLSGASWSKSNITEALVTAPDGTNTGKLTTATATVGTLFNHTGASATSTTMAFSIFARTGGTRATVPFIPRNNTTTTNFQTGTFNTVTGAITGAGWTSTPVAGAPGWFRLSFVQSTGITVGNNVRMFCGANGGALTAGDSWVTWGVQIEANAVTPYIASGAAATSVTDYSVAGSVATLSPAPLIRALLEWTGTNDNPPFIPRLGSAGSTVGFGKMGVRS